MSDDSSNAWQVFMTADEREAWEQMSKRRAQLDKKIANLRRTCMRRLKRAFNKTEPSLQGEAARIREIVVVVL